MVGHNILNLYGNYLISNFFLIETQGELFEIRKHKETVAYPAGKFQNNISGRGYVEKEITKNIIYYNYTIDGNKYVNSKISNVLIIPNLDLNVDENITVHYNVLFPKYSILFKCNILYFLINSIPIFLLIILIFYLKKKNN